MLTFSKAVENGRVLINVQAAVEQDNPRPDRFTALVDTGATATFVTRRLVEQVGADPIGQGTFASASEPSIPANLYGLSIAIPVDTQVEAGVETRSVGMHLTALELPYQPPDYDVVMGMDMLIRHCIFMSGDLFVMTVIPPF